MWIIPEAGNFRAENFVIFNFYGEETCFAWRKNLLVVFQYVQSISTAQLPVFVAPREIKNLRCFGGRVFVVCKPMGVYKLMQSHKFSLLSHNGIGIGPAYYRVLSVEDRWLYMKDKRTKVNNQLFPLDPSDNDCQISDLTLSSTNSEYRLRKALHLLEDDADEDICVVAYGKKIFKITRDDVQIIYRADGAVADVVPITEEETIVGFVLVMPKSAVLVYLDGEKLIFSNVYMDTEIRGLCAGTSGKSSNYIWIAHIDGSCIYYSVKDTSSDSFRRTGMENKPCLTIRNYKGKALVGLSENNQLIECNIEDLGFGKIDGEEFYDLRPNMLEGSEQLVDEICQMAKSLQSLNEELLEEQEKLKRINIYAHKQAIVHLPDVRVVRIADLMFLRIRFDGVLPMHCRVVALLRTNSGTIYCMKLVEESETVVDVPVEQIDLDNSVRLDIDLVTLAEESRAWCLLRDYTKAPELEKIPSVENDRTKFLRAKLAALQNLSTEGNLDLKKLCGMKKIIRRELQKF